MAQHKPREAIGGGSRAAPTTAPNRATGDKGWAKKPIGTA
jgi:hypothetical protein